MVAKPADELTSDWDPHGAAERADYPAVLARLRAQAPVAWCGRWGGFYTLTRYEDVVAASRDPATFTATKMTVIPSSPRKGLPRLPLQKDPPESDRYRKALNASFKANRISAFRAPLQAMAAKLMEGLMQSPQSADFARGFAEPFTQGALGILLGLDPDEALEVGRLSHAYVEKVQSEDLSGAGELSRLVDGFAVRLVDDRLARPRDPQVDIVSSLMAQEGAEFTPEELAGMVRLMLIGGHVVPRNFLCSVAWHLASHPDDAARLRTDPAFETGFIDECLRVYPANQALVRVATRDTEIGGTFIPEGTPVALNFLSANFDEAVFDNPDQFDPSRRPNRHIAFGIGPHMCLGLALAKLETQVTIEALLSAPALAVAGTPQWACWTEYGVTALTLNLQAKG